MIMNFGFIRGDRVDSNNTKQKNNDSMFNKVIADVYKQIKYRKKVNGVTYRRENI